MRQFLVYVFVLYISNISVRATTTDKVKFRELDPVSKELIMKLFIGDLALFGDGAYLKPRNYKDDIDDFKNVKVRPDDVWVATFPRSGTTLMQELVWLINNNFDYETAMKIELTERYYFLEHPRNHNSTVEKNQEYARHMPTFDMMVNSPSRRFIKTHLPFSLLPGNLLDTAKLVYVARDPRDVAVSYYHYKKIVKREYSGDFKTFWNMFTRDLVVHCPFLPHIKEAWAQRHNPNMLFMFYEELIKDLPAAVDRVAKFFDKDITNEQNKILCEHLNIKNFRKNTSVNPDWLNKGVEDLEKQGFVRKGVAGDWHEHFDDEMIVQAQLWLCDGLNGTDLFFPTMTSCDV
ncbi:sulfotransferase 1A1-like [Cydia pomonella]|uniref:sulfotransferase 1A1-like n=1 Tax=Cydia pomonella TaxID=82600 RepID=UPI002ADDA202|nr:sulfotransferase 1A1-like [Cydia pomonella]XP_061718256.1 sulfotransferase 1A1-like [Cydia pomonella]